MATLNRIKTLTEVVQFSDLYDLNAVTYFATLRDRTYKSTTAMQKYYPHVKEYLTRYLVTDEQRLKYRFRPDLLSTDIYGTPLLDWFIMWMNGRECPSKFTLKYYIWLVSPDDIQDLFISIRNKNSSALDANRVDNEVVL